MYVVWYMCIRAGYGRAGGGGRRAGKSRGGGRVAAELGSRNFGPAQASQCRPLPHLLPPEVLHAGSCIWSLLQARDTCVGSITCRVEKTLGGRRLYILTLGVLAPYRRLGIGSKLMKSVLDLCDQEEDFLDVYLHVQVNNEEALRFYEKFRFEVRETIRNYYRRIDPPDCHLLSKDLAGKKTLQADGRSEVMFSLKGGQPL